MASSTSRTPPGWIPETPDNEVEVGRTFGAYQEALRLIAARQGIPGLMTELTRINAAIQEHADRALASSLAAGPNLTDLTRSMDQVMLRTPATATPSGRAPSERRPLPSQPQPRSLLRSRSGGQGLGRAVAERIALAQIRADLREARDSDE